MDIKIGRLHITEKNDLTVGDLYCGGIHETPYDTNFFDIGAYIGFLEYFEKEFVRQTLVGFHRIIYSIPYNSWAFFHAACRTSSSVIPLICAKVSIT